MNTNNDKKNSSIIGIVIIAIWGCIVVGMMLYKIKSFSEQYTTNNTIDNSSIYYK